MVPERDPELTESRKAINAVLRLNEKARLTRDEIRRLASQGDLRQSMDEDAVRDTAMLVIGWRVALRQPDVRDDEVAAEATVERTTWSDPRYDALRRAFALEAATDSHVEAWRARYMPDSLASLDRIEETFDALEGTAISTGDLVPLRYMSPAARRPDGVRRRDVQADGPLGHLAWIAGLLSSRYPWEVSEASTFVATGLVAPVAPITVRLHDTPRSSTARIVLEVDPRAPADEVVRSYERARTRLRLSPPARSARPVSDRTAALALFAAERRSQPFAAMRDEWNQTFPHWSESSGKMFNRDARRAYSAVFGCAWGARTELDWVQPVWVYHDLSAPKYRELIASPGLSR